MKRNRSLQLTIFKEEIIMRKKDKVLLTGEILGGILIILGLCISAEIFALGSGICLLMPMVYEAITFKN